MKRLGDDGGRVHRYGFLVNPVAGMGGRVALKGTDGLVEEARRRGAEPVARDRALRGLERYGGDFRGTEFVTCGEPMGRGVLEEAGLESRVVYEPGAPTSAEDTRRACEAFLEEGVSLVVFCGGDGTAGDVHSAVDGEVPILGVPAGVKMQSGVFATSPEAAWGAADRFFVHGSVRDAEVLDVDEEAYRDGRLETRLYGVAPTPDGPVLQGSKSVRAGASEEEAKERVARFVAELIRSGTYVLAPGSTTGKVAELLDQDATLLGVDLFRDGEAEALDLSADDLLERVDGDTRVVISPIGSQGFLFGRGNQQVSPEVLRRVGPENLLIVATPGKVQNLERLVVDTGDPELDEELSEERRVLVGYRLAQRVPVEPA